MVSSPDSLWMSPVDSKPQPPQLPPARSKSIRGAPDYHLNLKSILGITTAASNGFAYSKCVSQFAVCAGSAAAVARIESNSNITWKYFRAGPSTLSTPKPGSIHETPTSATATENRLPTGTRGKAYTKTTRSPLIESSALPHDSMIAREKTRTVACVSMTVNGELLAVGESGHNPRIMLYSTETGSADVPLTSLREHTFGIRCLAFSQDMRWLCSIGDIHDGFVHLWAINPKSGAAKLHSTNKCTSFVQDVAFIGASFVSFGTRHVKLWRTLPTPPASPSKSGFDQPRTLSGRNCLLGILMESTFSCIAVVNDKTAVLCTDRGHICLLEDTGRTPELRLLLRVEFSIRCTAINNDGQQLIVGGPRGIIQIIPFSLYTEGGSVLATEHVKTLVSNELPEVMAIGLLHEKLVTIESNHTIRVYNAKRTTGGLNIDGAANIIPSHGNPILGVKFICQTMNRPSGFFSWSIDGSIIVYSPEGISTRKLTVPLDQQDDKCINELRVLRMSKDSGHYISGDKTGILRLLEISGCKECAYIRAHHGEINDIATVQRNEDIELVATCSRDRIIQVFQKRSSRLELLQTIEQHSSAVNEVRLHSKGSLLISSSSDRTVVIHSLAVAEGSMAYLATRIIALKASPLSIAFASEESSILVISTGDRHLNKYDISSGQWVSSTKFVNYDKNESVLLTNLAIHEANDCERLDCLLFGISSADRCIRVHDSNTGVTIAKEYGNSEGISGLAINPYRADNGETEYMVVSAGLDGSVMMWTFTAGVSRSEGHLGTSRLELVQPLRRVLSRSTFLEYQKTLEADGIRTLPSTPTGHRSTPHVRKRASDYALKAQSSNSMASRFTAKLETPTRTGFGDQCLSPLTTRSDCRTPIRQHHTKTTINANELDVLADRLCQSLRTYRRKLSSSSFDTVNPHKTQEVDRELDLTIHAMIDRAKRKSAISDFAVEDLLETYSEKLAQMVERRIAGGSSKTLQVQVGEEQDGSVHEEG